MRILISVDGSPDSVRALQFAHLMTGPLPAAVTLLAVNETGAGPAAIRGWIAQACEILRQGESRPEIEAIVRHGRTDMEIVAEARHGGYDLTVIGALADPGLRDLLVGPMASYVVSAVATNTLVVRGERKELKHILVPTEGYRYGEAAIRMAATIAAAHHARVTILYVTEPVPGIYQGLRAAEESVTALLQTNTREAVYLKRGARLLANAGVEGTIRIAEGILIHELFRVARQEDADLIVATSSQAHSPWRRMAEGDLTQKIVDNACRPVLVVRPSERERPKNFLERLRYTRRGVRVEESLE